MTPSDLDQDALEKAAREYDFVAPISDPPCSRYALASAFCVLLDSLGLVMVRELKPGVTGKGEGES